jgi:6-phosphogluconate dehydrogenase
MQLGMIGLGKMGAGMTRRLLLGEHEMVVFDRDPGAAAAAAADGAVGAGSLGDLAAKLAAPRAVWVMVPSGAPTEETVAHLAEVLEPGDTVIDGGNSNYKDTLRRAAGLGNKGLHAVDVGTSGGIWGAREGYSMMVGGEAEAVARLGPIFETLAPAADKGWGRVGPSGSGHFVKMVHNGSRRPDGGLCRGLQPDAP